MPPTTTGLRNFLINGPSDTASTEYALANHVEHPLNVNLREDAVIGRRL